MSKKQFEEFLVDHLISWAENSIEAGHRYQFTSPDAERSKALYKALVSKTNGCREVKDTRLAFIEVGQSKLVPVFHADTDGYTENFISHLRDEVASQQGALRGCALLVIHDSMLDTLINSAKDVAQEGNIWNPSKIKSLLHELIDQRDPKAKISECLLEFQFEQVVADGATMFGFKALYDAIADGDLRFDELGMLKDDTIIAWDDPKQIENRLRENQAISEKLDFYAEHFPNELTDKLAQHDLSEDFVKKNFPEDNVTAYKKKLEFGALKEEQDKNRSDLLELEKMSATGGELDECSETDKGAGLRKHHLILEIDQEQTHWAIDTTFLNAKLNNSNIKLQHTGNKAQTAEAFGDIQFKLNNAGGKRSCLTIEGSATGKARMFSVQIDTGKPKEKHYLRILILPKDDFYLEGFRNNYLLEPQKDRVTLRTDEHSLKIAEHGSTEVMTDNEQLFDAQLVGSVDFKKLASESDEVTFEVKGKYSTLCFNVEGAVDADGLTYPILLDQSRHSLLFNDDYYGSFNSAKNKVQLDNKEVAPKAKRLTLLQYEHRLCELKILAIKDNQAELKLSDILAKAPDLYDAYLALFNYLEQRKSLPSLEGWGPRFRALCDAVAEQYISALNAIELNSSLTQDQKDLLAIGIAHLGDDEQTQEYVTPFHPIVLAYNSNLAARLAEDQQAEQGASFKDLPKVTIQRLAAQGLLPYLFDAKNNFSFNIGEKENALWSRVVPQKNSNYDFVRTLVKDKTSKFVTAFGSLFIAGSKSQLIVNSVNNQDNQHVFMGLVDYVKNSKGILPAIHVNIYDDKEQRTLFDEFADTSSYEKLKELCELTKGKAKEQADTIIDVLRTQLTYSKFEHEDATEHKYAHITFFKNNELVCSTDVNVGEQPSGVVSAGLMPGEAAHNHNGDYFTSFGLKDVYIEDNLALQVASKVNGLLKPARRNGEQYTDSKSIALVVSDTFRQHLEVAYENSIWTTVIDPKVTLDFFESQKDVVLIHYSDNYTNSVNYDAITVTKQTDLYHKVLENDNGGHIEEFNAFNGEWLLNMVTAGANERKEKRGIISAYKYVNCLLADSPITWVPLSIAEIIRVAGNLGLKMSDSDFSRNAQGIKKGAISDDILFAGFYEDQLILLPVEVKTGRRQTHSKGVEQAKELKRYFTELLGQNTFAGHLYRGLFIRQVLMQIDKYKLYNVYKPNYFDPITSRTAWWLNGAYSLTDIPNYPEALVVVNVEDADFSTAQFTPVLNTLKIELPAGCLTHWVKTKLGELISSTTPALLQNIPEEYILKADCMNGVKPSAATESVQTTEEFEQDNDSELSCEKESKEDLPVVEDQTTYAQKQRKQMPAAELERIYQQVINCYYSHSISVYKPDDGPAYIEGPASILFRVAIDVGTDPKRLFDKSQSLKLVLRLEEEQEIGFSIAKGTVNIDVPKAPEQRYFVDQHDIWAPYWHRPEEVLEVPIGEDRNGDVISLNFSSSNCPHLLIGGTTGSGKSEALNTILYGMVKHYKPSELKLMLIDPKGTELNNFERFPHLLGEIGWDDEDAIKLLSHAVEEMQTRYSLFKELRVRSLSEYNAKVSPEQCIPWWVLVLDEYADLTSDRDKKKDIEAGLKRLAQKARAAGIHLIIATQKPSADVISTNLRSNLPAQLALRVKNGTESRVIIDDAGAETLNGKGDAFLKYEGKLVRVQCGRVSTG
ncbi:DNA phosphorothioation-dependent restriction protein DptH [Marinospirillum insulare]|uniref:FtsK domain-containing protein n=1 Tax=Marinospirillum insulare TaxID=217169 RepID=A0ABQ5ZW96_9GAMM|nr:DNA phosphorothioation-dependent restriction protein DptH [Marinospirillum insulare]GLR63731.1 hypothetical protein GCM10007878_11660 [Marinospirillum insulare]